MTGFKTSSRDVDRVGISISGHSVQCSQFCLSHSAVSESTYHHEAISGYIPSELSESVTLVETASLSSHQQPKWLLHSPRLCND